MGPPEGGVRGGREGDGTTGGRGKRWEGGGWDHRREG